MLRLRRETYLFLALLSIVFLLYDIWQISPVIVSPNDPIGLASHWTIFYWIGLATAMFDWILIFLDDSAGQFTHLLILIILGLFLQGARPLFELNAASPNAYYPYSEIQNILSTNHLVASSNPISYSSWPAFDFISASFQEVSGIGFDIAKYWYFCWSLCLIITTYCLGKRLKLTPSQCLLVSSLVLSSWLVGYAGEYHPRTLGMILFLMLLLPALAPRRTSTEAITTLFLFGGLVITHGLTSFVVILALLLLSLYRRDKKGIMLVGTCIVFFAAWTAYQAGTSLELVKQWSLYLIADIFGVSSKAVGQSVLSARIEHYSLLTYLISYGALIAGSLILLLRRKTVGERRKQVLISLCSIIGIALVLLTGYGEKVYRTYLFCLVPAACIIGLSIYNRKLLIVIMCLFFVIFPLANYCAESSWGQVLTTELKGSEFLALGMSPQSAFFVGYSETLVYYYNSTLVHVGAVMPEYLNITLASEVNLSVLDGLQYVCLSRQGTDRLVYKWGVDPFDTWPQTEAGQKADLVYDNHYFWIYENNLGR